MRNLQPAEQMPANLNIKYGLHQNFRYQVSKLCPRTLRSLKESHSEIRLVLSRLLMQVCTAPMLSKSDILMSLNSKQKSLCPLATTELFPKETKNRKQQENDRSAFGSDVLD